MKRTLLASLAAVSLLLASCAALLNPEQNNKSTDNNLASLSVSPGTLSPAFSAGVTTYTVNGLTATDTQLTVTATATDSKADVEGSTSHTLSTGANQFKVRVTSEAGAVKVYTLNANRPVAAASAKLSGLKVGGVPVAGFDADDFEYAVNVPNATTSVEIEATPEVESATVTGTGTKSLEVGQNSFTISVTNGASSADYTLTITRADVAINPSLGSLTVNGQTVTLVSDTYDYTVTVDNTTTTPSISATESHGGTVSTWEGPAELAIGDNVYSADATYQGTTLTYTVTIVRNSFASASAGVEAGINYLKDGNYTAASAAFTSAYALDSTDDGAKLWSALLDLSSINTDSALVDLYKNKLGVASYPSGLDDYMQGTWFNQEFYNSGEGLVPVASLDDDYNFVRGTVIEGYGDEGHSFYYYSEDYRETTVTGAIFEANSEGDDFIPSYMATMLGVGSSPALNVRYEYQERIIDMEHSLFLPELSVPEGFEFAENVPLLMDYPMLLMANVLERNPTGLNALIDTILSTTYGSKLATVETRLNALSDDLRIEIPVELLGEDTEVPEGVTVSVSKNELKTLLGQLKMTKAWLQYLSSVDFSVNLSALAPMYQGVDIPWVDANDNDIEDRWDTFYATGPTLKNSSFLADRANAATKRADSKATFISALEDLQSAVSGLTADWNSESSYYKGWLVFDETAEANQPGSAEWVESMTTLVEASLSQAENSLSRVVNALNSNTDLTVDLMALEDFPLGTLLVDADSESEALMTIRPSGLWEANLLNPRVWFTKTGNDYDAVVLVTDWDAGDNSHGSLTPTDFLALPYTGPSMSFDFADFYADPENVDYSAIEELDLSSGVLLNTSVVTSVFPQMTGQMGFALPGSMYIETLDEGPFDIWPAIPVVLDWLNRN